jgi:hypothetical protein
MRSALVAHRTIVQLSSCSADLPSIILRRECLVLVRISVFPNCDFSTIAEDQVKATLVLLRPAPHRLSRCNKVPIIRILSQKMRRHAAYCQVLPRPWPSVTATMCRARDDGALLAIDKRDSTSCWRRLQVVPRYTLRIYYPVSILSPIVALRCLTSGVPRCSAIRLISLESAKSFDRGQGWLRQTNHPTK